MGSHFTLPEYNLNIKYNEDAKLQRTCDILGSYGSYYLPCVSKNWQDSCKRNCSCNKCKKDSFYEFCQTLISPSHGLPSSYKLDLDKEIVAVRSLHQVWQHCQCSHLSDCKKSCLLGCDSMPHGKNVQMFW